MASCGCCDCGVDPRGGGAGRRRGPRPSQRRRGLRRSGRRRLLRPVGGIAGPRRRVRRHRMRRRLLSRGTHRPQHRRSVARVHHRRVRPAAVTESRFADVDASGPHAAFVERLADLGITVGCGDGAGFCGDRYVTRAEMADCCSVSCYR
ncbi:MAG: S-layer homology domain-containing protein [Acidimicrobiaceae bacterium]|nr:S-layer homology domain-containing protein [Acidimicrobiaceae bacterium]MYA00018.1 S-layer homology domain-containing protein [Acidimicrobiaceae bacterium]MYE76303.1 S-layer homology domain-containing protein [Acidimicrobiaceae bacterium]MYE98405.1 S-layer homology domain-containing protein [Acidimicrobiaceae bacterium]MYH42103.1 S-layer homology domain-containing protein [Acidimicrobiaceae bacterium]